MVKHFQCVVEVVDIRSQEAEEAVKASLGRSVLLLMKSKVPLANQISRIANIFEELRKNFLIQPQTLLELIIH